MNRFPVKAYFFILFLVTHITANSGVPAIPNEFSTTKGHLDCSYSPASIKLHTFHNDSIHRLNFRYPDKRRGVRPFILPAFLITTGTTFHFMTGFKESIRDYSQEHWAYLGRADDFIQFAPLVAVYALNAAGVKGKNNFGNRTAIAIKAILLREFIVSGLKFSTGVTRPSGGVHSFPSGHTSFAFTMAHFMHKEYGHLSNWYSFAAYASATSVGIMRITRNATG
ncbi:MAG TPA: hypothetical protein VKA10_01490, partial [Prolixibacteraceae bacterium]|nr:hypothetical protein [Prolixibacteraceae bacterium]